MSFEDVVRLSAPIVLAHGLCGFERIGLGRLTLARYFRGIPEYLESLGNRVLVTRVHPLAGIGRRAEILARRISQRFPSEPVHLIGHSMGGLDARGLLDLPGWPSRVLSLTTIATPHLGSPLADLAKLRVGRVYDLLRKFGVDHDGFLDVTRRAARAFHRSHAKPPGVACFSVAGVPEPENVCIPLRRLHEVVDKIEGPNDGLVSVASATAFGTPLRAWPFDHLRQVNWFLPRAGGTLDPAIALCYRNILINLATHGFGEAIEAAPTLTSINRQ